MAENAVGPTEIPLEGKKAMQKSLLLHSRRNSERKDIIVEEEFSGRNQSIGRLDVRAFVLSKKHPEVQQVRLIRRSTFSITLLFTHSHNSFVLDLI